MNLNAEEIINEIERVRQNDFLVIVEGRKDRIALEQLGLQEIFVLNEGGKGLYEKIEEICLKGRNVVVLTDLDKKGRKLYELLKNEISKRGLRVNNHLRDLLFRMRISHVEGLDSFIDNCQFKNSCLKSS